MQRHLLAWGTLVEFPATVHKSKWLMMSQPGFALVELGNLNIWILPNTRLSELELAFEITVSK